MEPIIALDADGVLLDYHKAYRQAWLRAFGVLPALKDPDAYWPIDRWDVELLEGERLAQFRAVFDGEFWSTIPAIDGAIEACHNLNNAGFRLICVTAMDEKFSLARHQNLLNLGFPIDSVIATPHIGNNGFSPKAEVLNQLKPIAFIDDYLPYFNGVDSSIHFALITREVNGSPNVGPELNRIQSMHTDLARFADWWLPAHVRWAHEPALKEK